MLIYINRKEHSFFFNLDYAKSFFVSKVTSCNNFVSNKNQVKKENISNDK